MRSAPPIFSLPVFASLLPPLTALILFSSPAAAQSARDSGRGRIADRPDAASAVRVDAERLLRDVRVLAAPEMEGRLTGSPGGRRAQDFITARFRALGLQPFHGGFEQRFPFQDPRTSPDAPPLTGTNLVGTLAGRDPSGAVVLVSAHYDHLGTRGGRLYPGADDNASGVAAMLAIAEWFTAHPPGRSLVFAAFDAEEQGLHGARHFVADPPLDLRRVTAMVNLDMVSRGRDDTLVVAGTSHHPALKPVVQAAAAGRALRVLFGHDTPAAAARGMEDWTASSDHAPFHAVGVPFLYFGVHEHPDYHRPTDTPDRIDPAFFVEATELVLDTVRRLATPGAVP